MPGAKPVYEHYHGGLQEHCCHAWKKWKDNQGTPKEPGRTRIPGRWLVIVIVSIRRHFQCRVLSNEFIDAARRRHASTVVHRYQICGGGEGEKGKEKERNERERERERRERERYESWLAEPRAVCQSREVSN